MAGLACLWMLLNAGCFVYWGALGFGFLLLICGLWVEVVGLFCVYCLCLCLGFIVCC